MTNNDIIRRLRYLFALDDQKMIALFKLVDYDLSLETLSGWLKKEEDPSLLVISDRELSTFLNALIIEKRGRRDGPLPEPEDPLSNNMILKKLKIAFDLKTDDILTLFQSIDKVISKHELSAFFRNPQHKSYRPMMDQYLRNFLHALQMNFKPKKDEPTKA